MAWKDHLQYKRYRERPRESLREKALKAQRDDLEADLDMALDLLHVKDVTIGELTRGNGHLADLVKYQRETLETERGR